MSQTTKKSDAARADAVTLPRQGNPLAKAIGDKLQVIREERGLDRDTAAAQCGLPPGRWSKFEDKLSVPEADEVQRITRWAFEGINYWSYPLSQERKTSRKITKGDGWRTHRFTCPKELDLSMARAANRLDMTIGGFIQLAIEDFLSKENIISTYQEAAERLTKARVVEMVNSDPYLRTFLSGDIDIAVKIGAKLIKHSRANKVTSPAERLVERFNVSDEDETWETIA